MAVTKGIRLGPNETRLLFGLESRESDLFTVGDAARILRASEQTAVEVLFRLRKKGRVIPVRKGRYLLVPARAGVPGFWTESTYRVIDAAVGGDYYIGFWTAMNYWWMTEQVPRTIHVVSPRRHRPFEFQGQRIRFVTMVPARIFGVSTQRSGKGAFWVSDRERTVLDGLLEPRYSGGLGEVAKGLWEIRRELDWDRLAGYVERLGVDAVRRRLGYLLEILRLARPVRERLGGDFLGYRWLDPSAPRRRLGYSERWGLILNVGREELLGWRRP